MIASPSFCRRSHRHTSNPDIPGSMTSSTAMSYAPCLARVSASTPSPATSTMYPSARRPRASSSAISGSSSTVSTRRAIGRPPPVVRSYGAGGGRPRAQRSGGQVHGVAHGVALQQQRSLVLLDRSRALAPDLDAEVGGERDDHGEEHEARNG